MNVFTFSLVELMFAVFSPPTAMGADDSVLMLINTCAHYHSTIDLPLTNTIVLHSRLISGIIQLEYPQ